MNVNVNRDTMEEEKEMRLPDTSFEEQMIQEEDPDILFAIQESLRLQKYEVQIESLRKKEEQRRLEQKQKEEDYLLAKKKKFGLLLARLKTLLQHSPSPQESLIIQDLIHGIEWSCTRSYFVFEFQPTYQSHPKDRHTWILHHLSKPFQKLLLDENLMHD